MPLSCRVIPIRAALLCCGLAMACSSEPKAEKVWTLADISLLPGDDVADSTGWTFGKDVPTELADPADGQLADSAAPDDATSDALAVADSTDDIGAPAADSAQPVDVQKPPISSCKGLCGQYVEDGACHCNAGCVAAKNCCDDYAKECSCSTAIDCNDGNDCTTDSCDKGFCKQIPFLGCCTSDADCAGGTTCKPAKCVTGTCTLQAKDCDDGLSCTTDVCDTVDGSCVHKLQVDKCEIGGKCFGAKDPDPTSNGCGTCDPKGDPHAWAVTPNKCLIEGACVSSGTASPTAPCATCDPTKSTTAWTVAAGQCVIGGVCIAAATVADGSFGCKVCDPTKSTSTWAIKTAACSDGNACTTGDACDPKGACVGKAKAGCCTNDADCSGMQPPPAACQVAVCTAGTCAIQADPTCCSSGSCCDLSTDPGKLMPAGTVCNYSMPVGKEYQCNDNNEEYRNLYYGCDGKSPVKCSSTTPGYGPWAVGKKCGAGFVCTLKTPSSSPLCIAQ